MYLHDKVFEICLYNYLSRAIATDVVNYSNNKLSTVLVENYNVRKVNVAQPSLNMICARLELILVQ